MKEWGILEPLEAEFVLLTGNKGSLAGEGISLEHSTM